MAMQDTLLSLLIYCNPFSIYASFDAYLNTSCNEDGRSVRQKYYLPLLNPRFQGRTQNRPPMDTIKSQKNQVHILKEHYQYISILILSSHLDCKVFIIVTSLQPSLFPSTLQGFHSSHFPSAFTLPIYNARFS